MGRLTTGLIAVLGVSLIIDTPALNAFASGSFAQARDDHGDDEHSRSLYARGIAGRDRS